MTPIAALAERTPSAEIPSPAQIAAKLGPDFAARAATADAGDVFVAENFKALKDAGLVDAGVPADLGGGGASITALSAMLRELAHHCSATALSFAMHTHQVAIPAWRWSRQQAAPVAPLLKRVAAEKLILLTNTPGVLDKSGNLLTGITPKEIDAMVADGTLSGGMLPKIGSALDAARNGVKSVHIIDGRVEHALLLEILTDHGVGTMIRSR